MAKCFAKLTSQDGSIIGNIELEQIAESAPTVIKGVVKGLSEVSTVSPQIRMSVDSLSQGKHGFSIHVFGDLSNAPTSVGEHFNPHGKNHGSPDNDERHVGSLGNIEADKDGKAEFHKEDNLVKLIGPQSIIGRSICVTAQADDLGVGGHEQSLMNGNAGAPIAWGVVGIKA